MIEEMVHSVKSIIRAIGVQETTFGEVFLNLKKKKAQQESVLQNYEKITISSSEVH